MKYAAEIISLMGAYPGRDWRMQDLVRHVAPVASPERRHSVRRSVFRVLVSLEDASVVMRLPSRSRGGYSTYRWKSET